MASNFRAQVGARGSANTPLARAADRYFELKSEIHRRLIVTGSGKVQGRFRAVSTQPKILDRLRIAGIEVPPAVFEELLNVNL